MIEGAQTGNMDLMGEYTLAADKAMVF